MHSDRRRNCNRSNSYRIFSIALIIIRITKPAAFDEESEKTYICTRYKDSYSMVFPHYTTQPDRCQLSVCVIWLQLNEGKTQKAIGFRKARSAFSLMLFYHSPAYKGIDIIDKKYYKAGKHTCVGAVRVGRK